MRSLLVGSVLIVGCFFAGMNTGYRAIYLLLALPGLLQLRRSITEPWLGAALAATIAAIPVLMWAEGIHRLLQLAFGAVGLTISAPKHPSLAFWTARELLWWWVVALLAATVSLFALECPLGRKGAKLFYPASELRSRP